MEWGRAKTILILSFLILNVLLGYQLWVGKLDLNRSNPDALEITQGILQQIEEKGILLQVPVPAETPKLQEVTVKFESEAISDRRFQLQSPLGGELQYHRGETMDMLSKVIPHAEVYQYDPISSTAQYDLLHQLQGQYPMFEVNLRLFRGSGGIVAYQQNYAEVMTAPEQKEQNVLPAITALGSLVGNNYLLFGTEIIDIRLGYHGQIYNSETQVLAPFWRIATKAGDVFYVHAITGAIEAPQKGK